MYFEGKFQNAIDTLNLVTTLLPSVKKEKDRNNCEGLAKLNLAQIYIKIGLPEKAMEYYHEIITISKKSKDLFKETLSWKGLGDLLYDLKDYHKSIEAERNTVALTLQTKNLITRMEAYNQMGYCYLDLNKLDSATYYNTQALELLQKEPNAIELCNAYILGTGIANKLGNYSQGILLSKKAVELATANNLEETKFITYENLGDSYQALKKYDSARKFFSLALQFYIGHGMYTEVRSAYFKILETKLSQKGDKESLDYLAKLDTAQDKALSQEKLKLVSAQEIKYETSLKQAKIEAQQAEISVRRQGNYWLSGFLAFAIIAALFLYFLYRKVTIQKKVIDEKNTKIELQKREILHFQKNSLNRLRSIFKRQSENVLLQENTKSNEDRLFAVSLLHSLLYGDNNETDLKEYLEKLCEAKSIQDEIAIMCMVDQPIKLKPILLQDIGIIINELVANANKHAFGNTINKKILVSATCKDQFVYLHIEDNGSGIEDKISSEDHNGFGLGYIHDLVKQHQGTIQSYNSNGAHFEISLHV